ncbi:augmin subunit 5-like protein [Tanacetum coccineum]
MSSGHNIPQDSPRRITKIVPSDVNDDWILSYQMPRIDAREYASSTIIPACMILIDILNNSKDLIDNEVSTLHQSPNNRLYMLPSTPQVLLESMGPYGSTRLNGVWKRMQPLDRSEIVLIGEGQNHRLGLFDTVMIKDNHTCVVGGVSNALKSVDLYLKNNNLQMGVKLLYETKNHKQQVDNDIPFVSFGDFDSPSLEKVQSKVTYEDELPAAERYESDDSFGEPASSVSEFPGKLQVNSGTSLKYALSYNPTIYDSLVKQFWQTATVRTLANGIQELVASVDNKEYAITEASIRSQLQLADAHSWEREHVPLLPAMLAGVAEDQGEGSAILAEPHHTPIDPIYIHITTINSSTLYHLNHHHLGQLTDRILRESMKEKEADFVTHTKASALGEAQKEDISPTILEATQILSQFYPSVVQTVNVTIPSPVKEQREGKAPITAEDVQATQKTKAQIEQEKDSLAEAKRLQALQDEEAARQVHLDALLAKRIYEEQELSEQQQKRKDEVQEAARYYTKEDWDTIRAKLEANA